MKLTHTLTIGSLFLLAAAQPVAPPQTQTTDIGNASSFVTGAPYVAPSPITLSPPTPPFFANLNCFDITQGHPCQPDPDDPNILLVSIGDQLEFYLVPLDPKTTLPKTMSFTITGMTTRTLTQTPPTAVTVTADTADKWSIVSSTPDYSTPLVTIHAK